LGAVASAKVTALTHGLLAMGFGLPAANRAPVSGFYRSFKDHLFFSKVCRSMTYVILMAWLLHMMG